MNTFERRTAFRIAVVSLLIAAIAGPVAWFTAKEHAEESIVSLAMEESTNLLRHFDLLHQDRQDAFTNAAKAIADGLFDIAEIYDAEGNKLVEEMTDDGQAIESQLPHHDRPRYSETSYDSLTLAGEQWLLRVFIPLKKTGTNGQEEINGYFEGVRVVPEWQKEQINTSSWVMALMAGCASLLCGLILYSVVVRLSRENEQAQAALIEVLQRSEQELEHKVAQRTQELQQEQAKTQELLYNILPRGIADELSATGKVAPVRHEAVSILFVDFSGFTQAVAAMPAQRIVAELNEIFHEFDRITDDCGVEKIKTIGDAYMAAAGLPVPCPDHAHRCVRAALQMQAFITRRNQDTAFKWGIRIGIHSGPVVAGVVGTRKYAFDVWGDTVNIASRMESAAEVGRINVSAYTCDLIREEFACEYRGKVEVKGKGGLDMYYVAQHDSV